jgi:hypothetical protein
MLPADVNPSPMIVFDVSDVQTSLTRLLSLGAEMDGAIQYSLEGNKVGALTVSFQLQLLFLLRKSARPCEAAKLID